MSGQLSPWALVVLVLGLVVFLITGVPVGAVVLVGAFFGLMLLGWSRLEGKLQRQGYRPSRMPPSERPDHTFDKMRSAAFRGGSRVGRGNASSPLVKLRIDESWAHLSGALPVFGGPPAVWIDRSTVRTVRRVRMRLSPGIRFETGDGRYDGVIFWTFDPAAVISAFRELGWPVSDVEAGTGPTDPWTPKS